MIKLSFTKEKFGDEDAYVFSLGENKIIPVIIPKDEEITVEWLENAIKTAFGYLSVFIK